MMRTLGPFRLDTAAGILFRGAEPVALGSRGVALLCALTERPGAPVSKDALIEAAWSGNVVEESNLTVQIAALRRVLGEEPGGERWIETLPRRGYRFVGPIVETEGKAESDRRGVERDDTRDEGDPGRRWSAKAERRQLGLELCVAIGALKSRIDGDLQCRVGIATGLVIVGDLGAVGDVRERGIVGDAPNIAMHCRLWGNRVWL